MIPVTFPPLLDLLVCLDFLYKCLAAYMNQPLEKSLFASRHHVKAVLLVPMMAWLVLTSLAKKLVADSSTGL